jgi:hypothetical protein
MTERTNDRPTSDSHVEITTDMSTRAAGSSALVDADIPDSSVS